MYQTWQLARREVLTMLRSQYPFWVISSFMAVLLFVTLSSWPDTRLINAASQSNVMLGSMAITMYFGLCIILPVVGATSIVAERENDTLELLLTCLVTDGQVIWAKLASTMTLYGLLVVASMPAFASTFFLVGVDPYWFSISLLLLFSSAMAHSGMGIMISAYCKRALSAIGLSLAATIVLNLGAGIFAAVGMVGGSAFSMVFASCYFLLCTLFLGSAAATALRRIPPPQKYESFASIQDPMVLRKRRRSFPYYLLDPLAAKRPIEDGRNSMFAREVRYGISRQGTNLVRLSYLTAVPFSLPILLLAIEPRQSPAGLYTAMMLMGALCAPSLSAGLISKERSLGSADMIRSTLLGDSEIIGGKFGASLVASTPLLGLLGFVTIAALYGDAGRWPAVSMAMVSFALTVSLGLAFGLLASCLSESTTTALISANLISATYFVGVPVLYIRFFDLTTTATILLPSPIYYFLHHAGDVAPFEADIFRYWMHVVVQLLALAGIYFLTIRAYLRWCRRAG